MIEAAARNGWLDKKITVLESLTAIKRAAQILSLVILLKLSQNAWIRF
jgi:delta-aminolevulinic acid dehydratase/porphobilinogen synthase